MARIEALPPHWIGARGDIHPVVICGAGLSGLSIAFALKRRGVPAQQRRAGQPRADQQWRDRAEMWRARIADALMKALFREDAPGYLSALSAYCEPHFDPRLGETLETAG